MAKTETPDREIWARWKAEIDFAQKDTRYTEWLQKAEKIVARYRDDRKAPAEIARRRMNILWSNVETLKPAVYSKMPKPVVERRWLDRDPAARMASTILERCAMFNMEVGYFHDATEKAVLDQLLPGLGQVWVRYEPQFEPAEEGVENAKIQGEEKTSEEVAEDGDGTPYEKLAYEKVCVDYVFYRDFLWGSARFWHEVPWVARRSWLTRSEIAEKFYGGDLEQAKRITLDYTPDRNGKSAAEEDKALSYFKKAEVWEIWNKADQSVYFFPPGTPDIMLKIDREPVLKLEGFWPCPAPLFSTQTNDTIVPVPDYVEYQDQAAELDDLTGRIAALTTALRANGVYDASFPALARLLQDGQDNKLIPVDQWAQFAEKGGMAGAISLVPIKEIAEVLIGLYQARAQVKNDLFEVTGMSDIVRGQSEGAQKTATEQRIKGQFASLRLEERRGEVARFCRDTLRIMSEIIAEVFSEETLLEMSGMGIMIEEEIQKAVAAVPPPPQPPQDQNIPPEQLQMMQMQAQQVFEQAQQQAAQQAQAKAMQEFQKAVHILRSDKLRGFRVDIETDSTIAADAEADKAAATELFTATMQGLTAAGEIVQTAPELIQPIGQMLMFAYRRFRVGRSMEASLEEALDAIEKRVEEMAKQPPQPTEEQIKAQAEMQKQEAEAKRDQQKFEMEMQAKNADMEIERERNAMDMTALEAKTKSQIMIAENNLRIKQEEFALKERELEMKEREMVLRSRAEEQSTILKAQAAEHGHDLNIQTMEAKAQAAKQQATAKPKEKA